MLNTRISLLKSNLTPIKKQKEELDFQLKNSILNLEKLKLELKESRKNLEFQTECYEWCKNILDLRNKEHLDKITNLISLALQTVFFDRNYEFILKIEDKRGVKNAVFILWEQLENGEVIETDFNGLGGSVRVIVSFCLSVFFINYFKLSPVIFLDEAMGALSNSYIDSFGEFVSSLCNQTGLIFVLISHDPRFRDLANVVYEIKNGTAKEVS